MFARAQHGDFVATRIRAYFPIAAWYDRCYSERAMLASLTQDLSYAARNLWRNQGFAASAVVMLAIGIAASTGLFAVIDAVVLHPLPFAGAERIARVRLLPASGPQRPSMVTADEFLALRRASTLDGVFIMDGFTKTLAGTPFPESLWIELYTGNALSLLGVQPVVGRIFTEADAPVGPEPQRVAVLTQRFWNRHFGGRPDAIGQTLRLDGEPFTVIGVAPAQYSLGSNDVILPLPMTFATSSTYPVQVRLKPHATMAAS